MKLAQNQALKIFITSIIILFICIFAVHSFNVKSITDRHIQLSRSIADESSKIIENQLLEKVKIVKTISVSPILLKALEISNDHYNSLTLQQRNREIQTKNDKWISIDDADHKFIKNYTNNHASEYLQNLQKAVEGEFGEIFVTNKYGALVSSTAKLSTLDHSYKYWWEGCFNNGAGAVYIDDRGYDESVGGYVLGIVLPITDGSEIVGILKANLNILGSINQIITNIKKDDSEQLFLIRSGGLIIFKEGIEPLSENISKEVLKKIKNNEKSFILENDGIYTVSEIDITANKSGYLFGGSFESVDHKKGNVNETWYAVDFHPISHIDIPIKNIFNVLVSIGLVLSIFLAVVSMILGNRIAKPIKELILQTKRIYDGDYNSEVIINRQDEIGELALSFNKMTKNLNEKTTSLDNLNTEIIERKRVEDNLMESEERFKKLSNLTFEGILIHKKGITIDVNESLVKMFGYTRDELIGKNAISLCVQKDYHAIVTKNITVNNPAPYEVIAIHKNGKTFPVEIEAKTVKSKGSQYRVAAIRNTSQRNLMLDELTKLSAAVQQSPSAIAITNKSGILEYVNPKFTELTGYTSNEALGLNPRILKSGMQPQKVYNDLWKTISSGKIWRGEFNNKKKNGELIWEAASISPITDRNGKITSYIKIAEDITDRKIAEQELIDTTIQLERSYEKSEKHRVANLVMLNDLNKTTKSLKAEITERKNATIALIESEKLSSAILEGSPIGISVRDKNGTLVLYNDSWIKIWGFKEKDLANKMIQRKELHFNSKDDYLKDHKQSIEDIYKKGGYYFISEIALKPGNKDKAKWITQQFYAIMGTDSKVERVVILTTDITDRKKTEESIIKSEERHRKLIQTAAEGFWLINSKAETINVNESLCQILGYSKKEIIGKTPFDFCDEKNQNIFEKQILKSTSVKHRNYEIELIRKNGDKVTTLFNATTMLDSKSNKTGSFAFITDITEKKQAEEEIKKNLKEKDTLLRELYHRTKNNMQVISSMLRMQTRSIDSKTVGSNLDNEFLHDNFEEVINKIKAMSLVHQKLYQAKDLSHINLKEYINDLVKLLMISFGIRSEKISLKLELEDIFVLIDTAIPLGLVLNELISNMFKHAFTGSKDDEVFIKLFKTEDETINIHLKDNGKGIPKGLDLEKVNTMGLQTVYTLVVHQLRGEASYKSGKGLKWQIKFKDNLHHVRV